MDLVFPEVKQNTEMTDLQKEEIIKDFALPVNKSYSEWEFETATASLEKAAEKKARKERQAMADTARQKRERAERYVMLKMGRLLQNNIIAAGRAVETLFKALRDGRPPEEVALVAVKGFSLMVNDTMLYDTIAKKYRQEYGIALEEKPPFNIVHLEPDKKEKEIGCINVKIKI
jgi:hypothetical protein